MVMPSLLKACPHPDLRQAHPEAYPENYLDFYSQQLGELDADSIHSFDALELHATITPDIPARTFTGNVALNVEVMEDNPEMIAIHLCECTVQSVQLNDSPIEYEYNGSLISIILPPGTGIGDLLNIEIDYEGPLRDDNRFGGMVYQPAQDCLYTFGEPYSTRYWLPCYDLPFDKLDIVEMTVILEETYRVASNGVLLEETDLGDGRCRTIWRSEDPISTYLISLAAHPYIRIPSGVYGLNDTEVNFWVYPADSALAAFEFGRTGQIIEYFETLFGPYPFNKYDQAMAPIFDGWGAMEHQTCTTYGENLVRMGNRNAENIVAHELGHQWWGDWVGPLTFSHIWLNEGFASYCEVLWAEHLDPALYEQTLFIFQVYYFAEDELIRYPIYDPPPDFLFGLAVYKKGALVLHTLRWLVGDENFFEALRQYGVEYGMGSAVTDEFRDVVEDVSGMELDAFFEEWVYHAGYPEYNFNTFTVTPNEHGSQVTINLLQQQVNAPYFSTPLPIRLFGGGGDVIVRAEVEPTAYQTLDLGDLDFVPTNWQFDPEHFIICTYTMNPPQPRIQLPEVYHDFGEVAIGNIAAWEMEILNVGDQALTITSIQSNNAAFEVEELDEFTLVPFAGTSVEIIFRPMARILSEADVSITSNDPNHHLIQAHVSGEGFIHFDPVDPTGAAYNIAITQALLDGQSLLLGDEIAVFDGELCVGSVGVTGAFPLPLRAWQEDLEDDRPGFTPGNPMIFRIWTEAFQLELPAEAVYQVGNGAFGFGPYTQLSLSATTGLPTMTLPLQGRYFELISTYLVPANLDAEAVFGNVEYLEIVYQSNGDIYLPNRINTIGDIELAQGYQLYCNTASSLTIRGELIDPLTEYTLYPRIWNWIGYPFNYSMMVSRAFAEFHDVLLIVQTDDGRLYIPPIPRDMQLNPGEGYFVFVTEQVTFQYPQDEALRAENNPDLPSSEFSPNQQTFSDYYENSPQPTGLPYAVLVSFGDELLALHPAIVELYDSVLLVGRAAVPDQGAEDSQKIIPVIAWGGSETYDLPGFTEGHPIRVRVLSADGVCLTEITSEKCYGKAPYAELALNLTPPAVPLNFSLGQPYPNPFNSTIQIDYDTPKIAEVRIKIYNLIGQEVTTLLNALKQPGHYSISFQAKDLTSGVYFLVMETAEYHKVCKILLLK